MRLAHKKQRLMHLNRQEAPAPTGKFWAHSRRRPLPTFPGKEGSSKNLLTARK
jgi:hypothetical protein